jgi:hypothetical protein
MRHVFQLDDDGCGVACLAMIAGVSYRKALKCMFGDQKVVKTETKDLRRALHRFAIGCSSRLIRSTRQCHYRNLEQDAILKTRTRSDGDWHWIVWDAKRKKFLDPEGEDDGYVRPPVSSFFLVKRK